MALGSPPANLLTSINTWVAPHLLEPLNHEIIPLLDGGVTEQVDHLSLLGTEVVAVGVKGSSISQHRH